MGDVNIDVDDLLLVRRGDLSEVFALVGKDVNAVIADDDLVLQAGGERFDGLDAERARVDLVDDVARAIVDDEQGVVVADEQGVGVLCEQRDLYWFVEGWRCDLMENGNLTAGERRRRRVAMSDGELRDEFTLPIEQVERGSRRTIGKSGTGGFNERVRR